MTDNDFFGERIVGVKNNIKVDSLLLKSRQCNQRCPLLGIEWSRVVYSEPLAAKSWMTGSCVNYT